MDPLEEWLKVVAGIFGNISVVCFTIPIVEPVLRGVHISETNPKLLVLGIGMGLAMVGCSAAALFLRRWW